MKRFKAGGGDTSGTSRDRAKSRFDARLADAEKRLRGKMEVGVESSGKDNEDGETGEASLMGFAARVGTEMVAALVVGALIGYGLDQIFGFRALFLIIFALAGGAAGTLNVLRAAEELKF